MFSSGWYIHILVWSHLFSWWIQIYFRLLYTHSFNHREKEDSGNERFVNIRYRAETCKSTVGKYPGDNDESYLEIDQYCTERDIYHELFHTIGKRDLFL